MSRSGAGNKKLPECKFFHELSFLNSVGKSQESHSNFIDINKTFVTETFQETAPISESYPGDSNFKVTPKSKRKQDDQSTYEAFLLKHLQATESQDDDADMLFLKSLHGSFQKLSEEKKEATKIQIQQLLYNARFT